MADLFTVGIILKAVDEASQVIRKMTQGAGQEFTTLGQKVKAVGDRLTQLGQTAVTNGVLMAGALQKPIQAFMDLESAQVDLHTATLRAGNVANTQLEALNAQAVELGNQLPGTTADFQAMFTMLVRQGMAPQQILDGMGKSTAYLSNILKMAPSAAAEFLSKMQDSTEVAAKDMMRLADQTQRLYFLGVEAHNMREAFAGVAPALGAIGMKGIEGVEAIAPLIAMLDQASLEGGAAGNALGKVFQKIFDADKIMDANSALKQYGIQLDFIDTQTGQWKGLENLISQLEKLKALQPGLRMEILKDIFGDDQEVKEALSTITTKGVAGYEAINRRMREQASINERIGGQLGTLRNLWEAFTGTVTNALAAIGALWGPELKQATKWLNDLAGAFQKLAAGPGAFDRSFAAMKGLNTELEKISAWPERLKTWAGVAAGITAATVAFGVLAMVIGKVTAAFSLLLAHPIVAAIAAIAIGAYLIITNWEKVKAFFAALPAWLQSQLTMMVNLIKAVAAAMYNAGANLISQLWEGMKSKYEAMKSWLNSALSDVGSWLIGRSPPPAGPLARIDVGGANLMAAWLHGMQSIPVRSEVQFLANQATRGYEDVGRSVGMPITMAAWLQGMQSIPVRSDRPTVTPQAAGRYSEGMTIHFAPQITIQGNGEPRRQVTEALQTSYREFQRLMTRYEADRARRTYAMA